MRTCPTCGQVIPQKPGRFCADCNERIRRHDKWHFEGGRCVHNDCKNPRFIPSEPPPLTMQGGLL